MHFVALAFGLTLLLAPPVASQEKAQFDLADIEKEIAQAAARPYHLGGFLEFQPILLGIDRDSAFSRSRFYREEPGHLLGQYGLRLRLDGSYRKNIFSFFVKSDTLARNDYAGWHENTRLFEAYTSVRPSANFVFEAGKKLMKWGKGYAWNPVSFIDRPKNPEDPEEALEGATVATADFIRSFAGPLKTLTLTTALIPVYKHVNAKFGEPRQVNFASKLYLLAYDTDIDLVVLTGSSRTTRYGFDFSRNLSTNFELHGEFAVVNNFKLTAIRENGQTAKRQFDALSYLLGLRYLSERETTYILEYYRNGTGFNREQMTDFYGFVERSYQTLVNTGHDSGMIRATRLADGSYGRPNAGKDYLYLRVSQKEPFDILYFTPALTSIMNLRDGSLVMIPELAYSPMTNLELRFRTPVQIGRRRTEFGEKQNDYRFEFRIRYHFGL